MKIAIIGFGTVGRGAYDILKDRKEILAQYTEPIEISYIVVTERSKARLAEQFGDTVVTGADYDRVLDEVDLIAEATGDTESAFDYMKRALEKKIAVVTANKAAVSAHYRELVELAEKNDTPFLCEAAVGGGIPVLTPLRGLALQNEIRGVRGILNGTCNYLLNAMYDDGADYAEVLAQCQEMGYAEQDPTDDVEGFDTRRKLHILIEMAMGAIDGDAIPTRGIAEIDGDIVGYLKARNKKIKLVASATKTARGIEAVVEPLIVDADSALGVLPLAINQVQVKGHWVGDVAFTGPGAGKEPTGNAVVADIVTAATKSDLPLLRRESLPLAGVRGRYFVAYPLEGDIVDRIDDGYAITKEIKRERLSELLPDTAFFARIEGDEWNR